MERLCGPLSSATLVAFFIFISNVNGACNNVKTDSYCAAKLAVANFCYLSSTERCGCEKACKTPPYCNEPSNLDSTCDCPFNAPYCSVHAWLHSYCASTCSLRFSVTCDPLITVIGASPLFNNDPPANSSVTPKYMDVVTFTCDPGWQQTSGSTSNQLRRVCIADGSWVLHPDYQESLVCKRVNCGSVPNVTNATPSQNAGVFEDTVTYTCDLGYNNTGQGQGNRTCNATSQWEQMGDDPVCEVVAECGAPPTLYQATPSASSGVYLSIITYSCQSGYIQSGTGVGRKQCSSDGQWASVANDPDIVCAPNPCIALTAIPNAVPSLSSGVYRDIVTYTCAPGYRQLGGSTGKRTCTAAGTWFVENADPLCTRVSCSSVPNVTNATPSQNAGVFEDMVTYTCDLGYNNTGLGQGKRTCNASTQWEQMENDPVCEVVECGAPPTLYQATPSASSGVYLSIITYSCQSGYIQSGTGVGRKQCSSDGQWTSVANDPDIVCVPKPCIALATILNAVPSLPSGVYRDIVTYTCAPGYSQSGGSTGKRTCTAAGTWFVENADPVCTRIGCGAPPSRIGATASATIGYLGENVTYACDQSHVRVGGGSGHVTCNLSALWEEDATDSAPLCLGMNIKFVNSRTEAQVAPPGVLTSASARSNLHCASLCALSVNCHGYSFNKQSGACALNNVSPHPVVTNMKKVYF